jgi:NitT/TauT family transport system substrate-binding protein
VGVGTAFLSLGCGGDVQRRTDDPDSRSAVSLRLPIPVVDAAFAPYYLAQDLGIFDRHRLSVTIEPGSAELNPVRMLDSGIDEFGVVGGPELAMSGRAAGAQIRGIVLLHRDANFPVIVTLKDTGLETVGDLNGKRIGFFIGHISTDVLRAFLSQEGVEYEQVDVGFNYGPLLAGQVEASWAFRTTAGITLPEQGVELNVIDPADYGILSQGHLIVTHDQLIEERHGLVQRFVDAVLEAVAYSLEHPDEAVASCMRRDRNFTQAIGEKQIAIYNETIRKNEVLGYVDLERMRAVAARQRRLGVLPRSYELEETFTNQFIDASPYSKAGRGAEAGESPQ